MINSSTLIQLGYSTEEAYKVMQRLANSLPTKTINMMIQFERFGRIEEVQRGIRHVSLDDALKLCDERLLNVRNIRSVNPEMWLTLKNRLATINQEQKEIR